MTDRYVIVHVDGSEQSYTTSRYYADMALSNAKQAHRLGWGPSPAYRIRIREKQFKATSWEARPNRDPLHPQSVYS
jgi:hypothetical protein